MWLFRVGDSLAVCGLDIDAERGLVWVVDVSGRVWFTTGVSALWPHGTGHWWQVDRHFAPFSLRLTLTPERVSVPRMCLSKCLSDLFRGVHLSPRLGGHTVANQPPSTTVLLSFTFILSPLTITPPPRNGVRSHSRCGTEYLQSLTKCNLALFRFYP